MRRRAAPAAAAAAALLGCAARPCAGRGDGGVVFMDSQGVWSVKMDGQMLTKVVDYTCFNCAGIAVVDLWPPEPQSLQWVVWADNTDVTTGTATAKIMRAPLDPQPGTVTPEVLCTTDVKPTGVAGLTVDDGGAAGAKREVYVYFTTFLQKQTDLAWQVWRCGTSNTSVTNPPQAALPWQGQRVTQDWGGSLSFSPKYRTIYLAATETSASEPLLLAIGADEPGGSGSWMEFKPMASQFWQTAQGMLSNLGAVAACGDTVTFQTHAAGESICDLYVFDADPAKPQQTAAQDSYLAVAPEWLVLDGRPRSLTTSDKPQPPNLDCIGDAPGYLVWSDNTDGTLKLFDSSIKNTTNIYSHPEGPTPAGGMGIGPVAWYSRVTQSPSVSPSVAPTDAPIGNPTAAPQISPTDAPAPVPITQAPAATPDTSAPQAGPQPAAATGAPVAPPGNATPGAVATTAPSAAVAPPSASEAPSAAAVTPPPTPQPPSAPIAAAAEESDDGFLTGLLIGIGAGLILLAICLFIMYRWLRGVRERQKDLEQAIIEKDRSLPEPPAPAPPPPAPEPAPLKYAPADAARVVSDAAAVQEGCAEIGAEFDPSRAGAACTVLVADAERQVYKVQYEEGEVAELPAWALADPAPPAPEPVQTTLRWKEGDCCRVTPDAGELRQRCEQECKWAPRMSKLPGAEVIVTQVEPEKGLVRVQIPGGRQWVVPIDCLSEPGDCGWRKGDQAGVIPEVGKLRDMCKAATCGWMEERSALAGTAVTVMDTRPEKGIARIRTATGDEHYIAIAALTTPPPPPPEALVEAPPRPQYHHGLRLPGQRGGGGSWATVSVPMGSATGTEGPGSLQSPMSASGASFLGSTPRSQSRRAGEWGASGSARQPPTPGLSGDSKAASARSPQSAGVSPPARHRSLQQPPGSARSAARSRQSTRDPAG